MSDRNKFSKEYMELENKYLGQKLVYDKLRTERDQLLEDKKALVDICRQALIAFEAPSDKNKGCETQQDYEYLLNELQKTQIHGHKEQGK